MEERTYVFYLWDKSDENKSLNQLLIDSDAFRLYDQALIVMDTLEHNVNKAINYHMTNLRESRKELQKLRDDKATLEENVTFLKGMWDSSEEREVQLREELSALRSAYKARQNDYTDLIGDYKQLQHEYAVDLETNEKMYADFRECFDMAVKDYGELQMAYGGQALDKMFLKGRIARKDEKIQLLNSTISDKDHYIKILKETISELNQEILDTVRRGSKNNLHLYIAQDHLNAALNEFGSKGEASLGLIEEMAELTQALTKWHRADPFIDKKEYTNHIIEELAHVFISYTILCNRFGINYSDIQEEIIKKWPQAYEEE